MKNISVEKISCRYQVRKLNENDIDEIYELSVGNPLYFQYCPPMVTKQSVLDDMSALPPNMTFNDKYYIGLFEGDTLIALMDLITNYPNEQTAFIGLFMLNRDYQHKGIGSQIVQELKAYLRDVGFDYIRLAYAKGNTQSKTFWTKNCFVPTGEEFERELYTAIAMQYVMVK